jgi:shikimate dehydrogenase
MAEPYAEVIGHPIAHSLSPAIHRHWLRALAFPGDYRATSCTPAQLPAYLASRRADPAWRGCNLTMPLKQQAAALLDELDGDALETGAVNCTVRSQGKLLGRNTDVDGVDAALASVHLPGDRAVIIGSGGAARAAIAELRRRGLTITLVSRNPDQALAAQEPGLSLIGFPEAPVAIPGAALVINASPLGMAGAPPMPATILDSLASAPGALALDMVYRPLDTLFLDAAAAAGLQTADGLTMLIGQARCAFAHFFGAAPPSDEEELRAVLIAQLPAD